LEKKLRRETRIIKETGESISLTKKTSREIPQNMGVNFSKVGGGKVQGKLLCGTLTMVRGDICSKGEGTVCTYLQIFIRG